MTVDTLSSSLSTFGTPTSVSTTSTNYHEKTVALFNQLLEKCHLGNIRPIHQISQCTLAALSEVYKSILRELPGEYMDRPANDIEKVANVQCMIDNIASDLEVDLSYIDAAAIVEKEAIHLHNFVEILDGLLDFLVDKLPNNTISSSGLSSPIKADCDESGTVDDDLTLAIANDDFIGLTSTEVTMSAESSKPSSLQVTPRELIAKYLEKYKIIDHKPPNSLKPSPESAAPNINPMLNDSDFVWENADSAIPDFMRPEGVEIMETLEEKPSQENSALLTATSGKESSRIYDIQVKITALSSPKISEKSSTLFSELKKKVADIEVIDRPGSEKELAASAPPLHEKQKSCASTVGAETAVNLPGTAALLSNPSLSKNKSDRLMYSDERVLGIGEHLRTLNCSDRVKKHLFGSDSLESSSTLVSSGQGSAPLPSAMPEKTLSDINISATSSKLSSTGMDKREWNELLKRVHINIKNTPRKTAPKDKKASVARPKTAPEIVGTSQKKTRANEPMSIKLQKALFSEKIGLVDNAKNDHLDTYKDINAAAIEKLQQEVAQLEEASAQATRVRRELNESIARPTASSPASRAKTVAASSAYKPRHQNFKKRNNAAAIKKNYPSRFDEEIELYDLIPNLISDYPAATFGGDFPPTELQALFKAQARQVESLSRAETREPSVKALDKDIQNMAEKYRKMADIVQKESERDKRLHDIKQKRQQDINVQRATQEKRQHQASVRRFYKDYRQGLQARLQADRTRQQQLFRELCQDALTLQRNRIQERRSILKEQKMRSAEVQKRELGRLENEWRNSLNSLTERVAGAKDELNQRAKAHKLILTKSRQGVKKSLEKQLATMCDDMVDKDRQMDEFRERDLERLKTELMSIKFRDPIAS